MLLVLVLIKVLDVYKRQEYANAIKLFKIDNIYLYALAIFGVALLLSIAGQLGDLIASKIKREYNIKDYGKIFPGHGGVLDLSLIHIFPWKVCSKEKKICLIKRKEDYNEMV